MASSLTALGWISLGSDDLKRSNFAKYSLALPWLWLRSSCFVTGLNYTNSLLRGDFLVLTVVKKALIISR